MKPYYDDGRGIVIYHGDCREVLATQDCEERFEEHQAIITDPPYGLGERWNGGGGSVGSSWRFNPAEAKAWDGRTVDGLVDLVCYGREVIIWGGNFYALPPSRCWLVWDKKQNDAWTTAQAELAWTNLDRPTRVFRFAQCEQANEGYKSHPTQKPLNLMQWCMKWTDAPLILDPFMGSGTTLRAAKNLQRRAIGIEIEERYCEIAAERLSQEVLAL